MVVSATHEQMWDIFRAASIFLKKHPEVPEDHKPSMHYALDENFKGIALDSNRRKYINLFGAVLISCRDHGYSDNVYNYVVLPFLRMCHNEFTDTVGNDVIGPWISKATKEMELQLLEYTMKRCIKEQHKAILN